MKFALGQIVGTPGALAKLEKAGRSPSEFLDRHVTGDWGDLSEEDKAANDAALAPGDDAGRLLSAYDLGLDKVWIITEWDRSVTTLLLPSEH